MSGCNIKRYEFLRSERFTPFYGITTEEFGELLQSNNLSEEDECVKQAKRYYNGYTFKNVTIFNTWAIVNFLDELQIKSFWCDSGSVTSLHSVFRIDVIKHDLETLLSEGGTVDFTYSSTTTYDDLLLLKSICTFEEFGATDTNIFFTFLFENGYLTPVNNVNDVLTVKLPNIEIKDHIYKKLMSYVLSYGMLHFNSIKGCAKLLDELFLAMDSRTDCKEYLIKISECIQNIFTSVPSVKLNESYLHSILLIIAWQTSGKFLSNVKCGIERNSSELDIAIYNGTCSIIIEAKYNENARIALDQILDKKYYKVFEFPEYFPNHVDNFILLGINLDQEKNVTMNAIINSTDKTTVPIKIE